MNLRQRTVHLWILLSLLASALACKAVSLAWEARGPALPTPGVKGSHSPAPPSASLPAATLTSTATTVLPEATFTPFPTETFTPTSTPTPPPPSATSTVPTEQLIQVTPSDIQLKVFEELWNVVDAHYLYPDFNGLDWDQIYDEYLGRIEAGLTDDAFYQAMDEMVFSLGDDHSTFFSPSEASELDDDYAGDYDYVGIGVMTNVVPARERLTILLVFPGSPAEQAGLKAHDSLLTIDGRPLVDNGEARYQLLRGPEGSQVELTVQSPGEAPRLVRLIRQRINSTLPVPNQVLTTPGGKRIGYLMLPTFHDINVDESVEASLNTMITAGPLEGLIIDNRHNGGGTSDVLSRTLAYFANDTVGHFVRRADRQPLVIEGRDIGKSQSLPLVVLVGPETASFGEIFAGILRDISRAMIIGETTDGNVEIMSVFNFTDGSRAWIAYQTFQPLNYPDEDWEQTGIIPDIIVVSDWDLYTLEQDPAILEALSYFDQNQGP